MTDGLQVRDQLSEINRGARKSLGKSDACFAHYEQLHRHRRNHFRVPSSSSTLASVWKKDMFSKARVTVKGLEKHDEKVDIETAEEEGHDECEVSGATIGRGFHDGFMT